MKKLRGNKKGFTLIELIVVMIIIGILVLLATPKFLRYVRDANATSLQVDAKVIGDADLYQNLKADDEIDIDGIKSRGNEYNMTDIALQKYDHPIFKDEFIEEGTKPNFDEKKKWDFDKWLLALAGSYEEITGKVVLNEGRTELDKDADGYDDFMATKYAALNSQALASHIRNTRYGVNNFIVATSGLAEGEAYYMAYVKDGDNIMHTSLVSSGIRHDGSDR